MIVEDIKRDFLNILYDETVLIFTTLDVDGLCTVKILELIFEHQKTRACVVPVTGKLELREKFYENKKKSDLVILVNCGGSYDILEHLQYPSKVVFFIIDSHRPLNILNVYDETQQIRIFVSPDDKEDILPFDSLFRTPDLLESDSDSDDEESTSNEQSAAEKRLARQARRNQNIKIAREFEEKRNEFLHDYYKFNSHNPPSTLTVLEFCSYTSVRNSDVIWYGILSITESFMLHRLDASRYALLVAKMREQVTRVAHELQADLGGLKISYKQDLYLYFYRNWTLYESIKNTPLWRCSFRLWSMKGEERLQAYLTEIGLPLREAKEDFNSMDICIQNQLKNLLRSKAEKFKVLDDIFFGSFIAEVEYSHKFCSLDQVLCLLSALGDPDVESQNKFSAALATLGKLNVEDTSYSMERAKKLISIITSQVQIFIHHKEVYATTEFLYAIMQHGTHYSSHFLHPSTALLLAIHTLEAFAVSSQKRRAKQLPLLLFIPQTESLFLVVGIPPLSAVRDKNLFGSVFELAASRLEPGAVILDSHEKYFCNVKSLYKEKFLEAISLLLT